jgi:hypothetical protein
MRSARGDVNTAPKRGPYAWYWMNHIAQDIMGKPAPSQTCNSRLEWCSTLDKTGQSGFSFSNVTLWEAKVLDNRNDAVLASPVVIGWINSAACASAASSWKAQESGRFYEFSA